MSKSQKHQTIALHEQLTDEEYRRLQSFCDRFQQLWANFEDLKSSGLNLSGHHVYDINNIIQTSVDLGVSRFRIKGFLVDYRHFHGQEEPANFHRNLNAITRCCRDSRLIETVNLNRKRWNDAGALSGWYNDFTLDEIVDAVFKEDIFHTDPRGKQVRVRLGDVSAGLSSEALWFEITNMACARMLIIRNINWILEPIFLGGNEIRIPL